MANRRFYQFLYSFQKAPVFLWAKVAIGATGAPTLDASFSRGVTSITRNSAGLYTVVLNDNYSDLLGVNPTLVLASGSPAAITSVVRANNVAAAAKSVQVGFLDSAGAAVEVTNGATLLLKIELKNSGVN